MRSTPGRISPNTYPIAATATAPAYDYETNASPSPVRPESKISEAPLPAGQQALFPSAVAEPRVIPFDSLTTQAERESIRARGAGLVRPAPVKTAKVELRRARPRKTHTADERQLDLLGQEQVVAAPPVSSIICDAPVAPVRLRVEAAAADAALIVLGCAFGIALFAFEGGAFSFNRHVLPFFAVALATVPLFYKLLWSFAGRDTPGMRVSGLRLVDFDGNPPSVSRRYQRLFGGILSFFAAGIGLIWSFVDEDGLTWHDHISNTFPTLEPEK